MPIHADYGQGNRIRLIESIWCLPTSLADASELCRMLTSRTEQKPEAAWSEPAVTIPNAAHCIIESEKVRDYLLNLAHPAGKSKASFFVSMGFRQSEWEILAKALQQLIQHSPITITMTSPHGQKDIVDGPLVTPQGPVPLIHTVWVVDTGTDRPRLITAYPFD